jgi:hypothetical protein
MSAEKALTEEQRRHEMAAQEKALADEAYERHRVATKEKALADEAYEQRLAAMQEKALADQCCQVTAALEKALANDANEQCRAAAHEKALADEANDQRQAAAQDKALANEANKQHRQVTAARENALADDAYERYYRESANVFPPPHRPTSYKDAVLSTMGGSLRAKSLVVAPLSHPSTMVDGQLQTACRCSRPRRRVGCRHGPWAPNPQEHLLRGRQHRPRAPNQSTENGWA